MLMEDNDEEVAEAKLMDMSDNVGKGDVDDGGLITLLSITSLE